MSLISCPSCGKEVSDVATSCPSCGHPIKATTIEKTGKRWKLIKLGSKISIIVGVIITFTTLSYPPTPIIGVLLLGGGMIFYLIAVIGKWWYHE